MATIKEFYVISFFVSFNVATIKEFYIIFFVSFDDVKFIVRL